MSVVLTSHFARWDGVPRSTQKSLRKEAKNEGIQKLAGAEGGRGRFSERGGLGGGGSVWFI